MEAFKVTQHSHTSTIKPVLTGLIKPVLFLTSSDRIPARGMEAVKVTEYSHIEAVKVTYRRYKTGFTGLIKPVVFLTGPGHGGCQRNLVFTHRGRRGNVVFKPVYTN